MAKFCKKSKSRGQSLVEVVVALGMIGATVTAMMSLVVATKNILYQSTVTTKANALAQEGAEIVRHQRDIGCGFNNVLSKLTASNHNVVIKGDIQPGSSEDLQLKVAGDVPNQIDNFSTDFKRDIIIYKLNDSGLSSSAYTSELTNNTDSSNAICTDGDLSNDYDCASNYALIVVQIKDKNDRMITELRNIISVR